MSENRFRRYSARFERAHPSEILSWSWREFEPDIAVTSSFQSQSVPLLHMVSIHAPELRVLFLDTGFHFPETLAFRDRLAKRWSLNVVNLKAPMGHQNFKLLHGELYQVNPDLCCYINKVEPLNAGLRGLNAWITGIRRDQTADRRATPILSQDSEGRVRICPFANWSTREIHAYRLEYGLPEHPLSSQGYPSIGCAPCTRPVCEGADERSGRWADSAKTECGIHTLLGKAGGK